MEKDKFVIWSIEHNSFWASDRCGYVKNFLSAGVYSYKEACEIVENANKHSDNKPQEAMIKIN